MNKSHTRDNINPELSRFAHLPFRPDGSLGRNWCGSLIPAALDGAAVCLIWLALQEASRSSDAAKITASAGHTLRRGTVTERTRRPFASHCAPARHFGRSRARPSSRSEETGARRKQRLSLNLRVRYRRL